MPVTKGDRITEGVKVNIQTKARCSECGRVFDLFDEVDAAEFFEGHDCEEEGGE